VTSPGPHLPERPPHGSASPVPRSWQDLRDRRRRNIANSRPLPEWVRRLAWVLDDAFEVPGFGGRRVGVDGLIAFVPVIGDVAGIVLGVIIVLAGIGAGVSVPTLLRMMLNVGVEALMGLIPFVGAVFDMAYKANNRNVALIEADLADRAATRRSSIRALLLSAVVVVAAILLIVAIVIAVIAVLAWLLSRWF
jgi:hypothetical protein